MWICWRVNNCPESVRLKLIAENKSMHEFSIIENLIPQVEDFLKKGNYRKALKIFLEVGEMSGVIPDALAFAYDICAKDTLLEGTELCIRLIPVTASCEDCFLKFEVHNYSFFCPQCNSTELKLLTGKELKVREIEVE